MNAHELLALLPAMTSDRYILEDQPDCIVVTGRDTASMFNYLVMGREDVDRVVPGRITWKHWRMGEYGVWRAAAVQHLESHL